MIITHLYLSPGHNYFGHHGREPSEHPMIAVDEADCVAGRGLRGDRFFDYKPDYSGQITFFAGEVYDELVATLLPDMFAPSAAPPEPSVFRRNAITRGVDLNVLIGREFTLQGLRFFAVSECSPCHWMERAFASGAKRALTDRGGLRAKILTSGPLRVEAHASTAGEAARHAPA